MTDDPTIATSAVSVRERLIREQAATPDGLVEMVETQLAEDLHDDQCHCDSYPAACVSGMTRDELACASYSPEDTIQVLRELGLLVVGPALDDEAAFEVRVAAVAEILRTHQYDEGTDGRHPGRCFCGNQMGDQDEHQAIAIVEAGWRPGAALAAPREEAS